MVKWHKYLIYLRPDHKQLNLNAMEKFLENVRKTRTLLLDLLNENEAQIILSESYEWRRDNVESVYYAGRIKGRCGSKPHFLRKRRQLLDEVIPRENLKIRGIILFNAKKEGKGKLQKWANRYEIITFFNILQCNVHNIVNHEKIMKYANAVN